MDVQLSEFQTALQSSVRQFVNQEVIPVASEYEHKDEYPHPLVNRMKELGYFGALVPECYGGSEMDAMSFTVLTEELARGWMSLTGVLGRPFDGGMDDQRVRQRRAATELASGCG